MIRTRLVRLLVLTLIGLAASTTRVRAEWLVDLYGGGAFSNDPDISITKNLDAEGLSVDTLDATLKSLKIDDFATGGLRLGYWFDTRKAFLGFDLGLSLDAFYFPVKIPDQTAAASANADFDIAVGGERFEVIAGEDQPVQIPKITTDSAVITPELMLRRSFLANAAFPQGRLQPYLTAGPALLFTGDDPHITVGVKAGLGVLWQFHQHFALLAEYRYTHFDVRTKDADVLIDNVVARQTVVEADVNTHFVIAGISLRFK